MRNFFTLSLMLLAAVSCRVDAPATPDAGSAASPHTWQDAYAAWAGADCQHYLLCDSTDFYLMYPGSGLSACAAQVVAWDCEADPRCGDPYSYDWSAIQACVASLGSAACSVEWPPACLAALTPGDAA